MIAWIALAPAAFADGLPLDAELLRPWPAPGGALLAGDPAPEGGAARAGAVFQLESHPLVLVAGGNTVATVIGTRFRADVGGSFDVGRLSFALSGPLVVSSGGTTSDLGDSGAAIGDAILGARVGIVQTGPVRAGVRGDLLLPVATGAWIGEDRVRGEVAVSAATVGDVSVHAELGAMLRTRLLIPSLDLTVGNEISWVVGVTPRLAEHLNAQVTAYGRAPLGLNGGPGTAPAEVLAGLSTTGPLAIDAGIGRGIGAGYGTSAFRATVGVTITRPPKPAPVVPVASHAPDDVPEDRPVVEVPELPPLPPPAVDAAPWETDQLARIVGQRIELRDEIKFAVGTTDILPDSLPIVAQVAALVGPGHELIVEGHASEEGEYAQNYDLSVARARAVWEALVRAGVPPERMAFLGLGEVGASGDLAAQRRVAFRLIDLGEATPSGPVIAPWDGQPIQGAP